MWALCACLWVAACVRWGCVLLAEVGSQWLFTHQPIVHVPSTRLCGGRGGGGGGARAANVTLLSAADVTLFCSALLHPQIRAALLSAGRSVLVWYSSVMLPWRPLQRPVVPVSLPRRTEERWRSVLPEVHQARPDGPPLSTMHKDGK